MPQDTIGLLVKNCSAPNSSLVLSACFVLLLVLLPDVSTWTAMPICLVLLFWSILLTTNLKWLLPLPSVSPQMD